MDIITYAHLLLEKALELGASDIHVDSVELGVRVSLRRDGVLELFDSMGAQAGLSLLLRLKLMAGMDVSQQRLPQDGVLRVDTAQGPADFRASSLPGFWGEGLALRVMGARRGLRPLEDLGLTACQLVEVQALLDRREGLFLVTGPTGSGKTTFIYACLKVLSTLDRKVMTAEDPVEVTLPGVVQLSVTADFSYADALRALLRQSPDTLLIGEIRDSHSAHTAVEAALSGHQVLSSLHTRTPHEAAQRLQDLGVERNLVESTLLASIGTRLVPCPCTACTAGEECVLCRKTGFYGRRGVFEVVGASGGKGRVP